MIQDSLRTIELGAAQSHQNLTIFPLFPGRPARLSYLSLREALEKELLEITEVSEGGSVPQLKAINKGDWPILLIDGEELEGAKQNRIVNTSLLLAAHSEHLIPVSCTEQGRWSYSSRQFSDSEVVMASRSRYRKSSRLYASLKANQGYDAMQGEVWRDIEAIHAKSGSMSRTRAMKDAFLHKEADIQSFIEAFPLQPGQNGLLAFLNGQLMGLDFVSRPEAYAHLHGKLVKSHAIEAATEAESKAGGEIPEVAATNFLSGLGKLAAEERPQPLGLGADFRFEGAGSAGAALGVDSEVIHLTAYNTEAIGDIDASIDHFRSRQDRQQYLRTRRWEEARRREQAEWEAEQRQEAEQQNQGQEPGPRPQAEQSGQTEKAGKKSSWFQRLRDAF